LGEIVGAGRIAAGPGEAGDQAELNRVFADAEDDRDGGGRGFGCQGCSVAAKRCDNGHATADQIGRELWKSIEPALLLGPAIYDCHILTFDVSGLAETPAEGIHVCKRSGCPINEHPHHRHRRLRPHRKRPDRRAA
jgi:hypothetical protein